MCLIRVTLGRALVHDAVQPHPDYGAGHRQPVAAGAVSVARMGGALLSSATMMVHVSPSWQVNSVASTARAWWTGRPSPG